ALAHWGWTGVTVVAAGAAALALGLRVWPATGNRAIIAAR
ncbi:MAG TPA: MFS transporter, partial [Achromobacter sp.]|nr:MFS transporter [Achromobacter sp.]